MHDGVERTFDAGFGGPAPAWPGGAGAARATSELWRPPHEVDPDTERTEGLLDAPCPVVWLCACDSYLPLSWL
jgi:hypothetical protein